MEAKKAFYATLVESTNQEDKQKNREKYNATYKETQLTVTTTKTIGLEHLYEELEGKLR